MSTHKCICGKEVSSYDRKHFKKCISYKKYEKTFIINFDKQYKNKIINLIKIGSPKNRLEKVIHHYINKMADMDFSLGYVHNYFIDNYRDLYDFHEEKRWDRRNKLAKREWKKRNITNPGQLESHKKRLQKSNKEKHNPFSTEEFMMIEFIKGNRILPEMKEDFFRYKKKVERLTKKNKKLLGAPKFCYYSNLPITNDKSFNYNMFNYATIDHKISIIRGFLNNIPPEKIGSLKNIVWCARFINSIKREKTEKEFLSSDEFFRFKLIQQKIVKLLEKKGFYNEN